MMLMLRAMRILPIQLSQVIMCVDVIGWIANGGKEMMFGVLITVHECAQVIVCTGIRWPQSRTRSSQVDWTVAKQPHTHTHIVVLNKWELTAELYGSVRWRVPDDRCLSGNWQSYNAFWRCAVTPSGPPCNTYHKWAERSHRLEHYILTACFPCFSFLSILQSSTPTLCDIYRLRSFI